MNHHYMNLHLNLKLLPLFNSIILSKKKSTIKCLQNSIDKNFIKATKELMKIPDLVADTKLFYLNNVIINE